MELEICKLDDELVQDDLTDTQRITHVFGKAIHDFFTHHITLLVS
jgi:hypothetical protein